MSDGISEWHKMRWEQELREMSEDERKRALRARPSVPELLPPAPESEPNVAESPVSPFGHELAEPYTDEDGVVYGGRPFWLWARDTIFDVTYGLKRKMLQVGLCCLASFWLGYWFGAS